ncbi:MAG: NTP transferase domain-containing protein [Planctomycetes bacterium]|nr:NTP transferase domain-containing protein [Planctomycetota bacterium]
MRAIILAAGQGKRMLSLTKDLPKCLLPLGDSTILGRLISQLRKFDVNDISVVVGYKKEQVIEEIARLGSCGVTIIDNERYTEDINILSLSLALQKDSSPFYLFEADCIFEDKCFELIIDLDYRDKSAWYTIGDFTSDQSGGIIKTNEFNEVIDIKIVDAYKNEYKTYKKMIGALKIGENQIQLYADYLFKACNNSLRQYYHMPWIEHINEFESYLCDIGHLKAMSFNTVEDYYEARKIFSNEISQHQSIETY